MTNEKLKLEFVHHTTPWMSLKVPHNVLFEFC